LSEILKISVVLLKDDVRSQLAPLVTSPPAPLPWRGEFVTTAALPSLDENELLLSLIGVDT